MLCDIQAEFRSNPLDAHIVEGALRLTDLEERKICQIRAELIGRISYLCPTYHSGNNFMDPEKPNYTLKQCQFLALSHTFDQHPDHYQTFRFEVPHYIDLSEAMRKRLGLQRSRLPTRYRLPPSFAEESASYLQSIFIPWKEPSKAKVQYLLKVTATWEKKAGMSRLLGSSSHKSFRKPITVVPSLMGEVQTTLPGYSAKSDRQWYREPCNTSDGLGGICSVFVHARAKLCVMGDTRLALEKPLLFCLELNGNQSTSIETVVVVDLLKIVSTRTVTVRRQMERRGDVTVVQRLQVDPTPDQAQAEATTGSNAINVAHFNTTDRLLNGMMCLVDSCKHGPLSPSFNFAEVAVEYRLQVRVSSGQSHFAFLTPAITLDTEPEDCPPPYYSLSND